jgi:hypothetical protein
VIIPARIAEFRKVYQRERVSRMYSGTIHLMLTVGASLVVVLYCLLQLTNVGPIEWLTIPITFLYANITEYVAHRGPMHLRLRGLRMVFKDHTLEHHHYFTSEWMELSGLRDLAAILFPPINLALFVGVTGIAVAFLLGKWISANVGYLFLATALAYYANYELFHLAYHMPESSPIGRLRFMKKLRLHHTRHHDLQLMSRFCFNITYPICDLIFGTMAPKAAPKTAPTGKDAATSRGSQAAASRSSSRVPTK